MTQAIIRLRPATDTDLEQINRVIDAAIMTWNLPERVKRLSLSTYHYTPVDLQHYEIIVALQQDQIIGVVAWDRQAQPIDAQLQGLFIHGLYVDPVMQGRGIGMRLFRRVEQAASETHQDGLLVKAHKHAEGFYQACGMQKLPVRDQERDYAHRYWKPVRSRA